MFPCRALTHETIQFLVFRMKTPIPLFSNSVYVIQQNQGNKSIATSKTRQKTSTLLATSSCFVIIILLGSHPKFLNYFSIGFNDFYRDYVLSRWLFPCLFTSQNVLLFLNYLFKLVLLNKIVCMHLLNNAIARDLKFLSKIK